MRISGRYLVTVGAEHIDGDDRRLRYDWGFESTGYLRRGERSIAGTLAWTHRLISKDKSIDRIVYYYRFGDRTYMSGRFRWNAYFGAGAERNDGWHFGATRAVLTGAIEIPSIRTGLNVAYAPTYLPGRSGRRMYHELAIFLDTTALARVGSIFQ